MAASTCLPSVAIRYEDICQDSFYFTEADEDSQFEEDAFRKVGREDKKFWIQSREKKFLILTTDNNLKAQDLDTVERRQSDCKFNIQVYLDNCKEAKMGKPVMLYSCKDGKKMVVCCRSNRDVYPKQMEPPSNIPGNNHEAMFYQTEISSGRYMFESTRYKKHFLAFEPDQGHFLKLLLHPKEDDEMDMSCFVNVLKA